MQLNKLLSIILSLILCISAFIFPFMKAAEYSYAINDDVLWQPLNSENELVDAFQAYCKSRDLTIEGSVADAVTTATTGTFNGLCNKLGIDITALQADIKKSTDSMGKIQYLFDSNGITAYNRIFAQLLQDNELEVGDSVSAQDPKYIYQGKMIEDKYLIYVISGNGTELSNHNRITTFGVPIYNGQSLYNAGSGSFVLGDKTITHNTNNSSYGNRFFGSNTWGEVYSQLTYIVSTTVNPKGRVYNSDIGIAYFPAMNKYYLLLYTQYQDTSGNTLYDIKIPVAINFDSQDIDDNVNVYITTNNTTINNNNYEGDTIINQDGTPTDPNEPNDPDDPNVPNYNPYPDGGGTTTGPNNTGGGSGADDTDVTFPNFDFQLPEIDWSLGDLSQKFPFSIPFDLVSFFTVLNATPEAPAIDAEIPLGSWYTWHFEADFSQFDNYAAIIRNVEFIAFCIGLIYLTVRLVKG